MSQQRKVEVFTVGCPVCDETVQMVQSLACPSCDVTVHDMHDATVASRAESLGIDRVPAVVVDGTLADCCRGGAIDETALTAAGIGQSVA